MSKVSVKDHTMRIIMKLQIDLADWRLLYVITSYPCSWTWSKYSKLCKGPWQPPSSIILIWRKCRTFGPRWRSSGCGWMEVQWFCGWGCSGGLTCIERNVSLVNAKLPAAALQQCSPAPAVCLCSTHTAVLLNLHSGVMLKLAYITSHSGSLFFKCKEK